MSDDHSPYTYRNKRIDGVVHEFKSIEDDNNFGITKCRTRYTVDHVALSSEAMWRGVKPAEDAAKHDPVTCIACLMWDEEEWD